MSARSSIFALFPVAVALLGASCEREERRFSEMPPLLQHRGATSMSPLHPGQAPLPASPQNPYEDNAWAINEGKRLYGWFNCVECHAHGGGNIGPPLRDERWIYGAQPANVFASIAYGRPGGMPSYLGKIPEHQIWQIVAYVRSMSGLVRKDVAPGRSDSMSIKAPERTSEKRPPRSEPAEPRR